MSQLFTIATETINTYVELGNKLFHVNMSPPQLNLNLKGRSAGKYIPSNRSISLNPDLFQENVNEFINQTIPHEVAHAFQRSIYGQHMNGKRVMPHGKEWQGIMYAFGKDPNRCHNYVTKPARVFKKYTYTCNCTTHKVGPKIHNNLSTGTRYICKKCKSLLQYA